MIINEFSVPAIGALKSTDADAIRQITAVLMEEIVRLRKDVDLLIKTQQDAKKNYVKQFTPDKKGVYR